MRAVGKADRAGGARNLLHRHAMLEIAEPGAAVRFRHGDAVQPERAHLRPELARKPVLAVDPLGERRDAVGRRSARLCRAACRRFRRGRNRKGGERLEAWRVLPGGIRHPAHSHREWSLEARRPVIQIGTPRLPAYRRYFTNGVSCADAVVELSRGRVGMRRQPIDLIGASFVGGAIDRLDQRAPGARAARLGTDEKILQIAASDRSPRSPDGRGSARCRRACRPHRMRRRPWIGPAGSTIRRQVASVTSSGTDVS